MFEKYQMASPPEPAPTGPPAIPQRPMPEDPLAKVKNGPWYRKLAFVAGMGLSPQFAHRVGGLQDQYRAEMNDVQQAQSSREYNEWQAQQDRAYKEQQAKAEWEQGAPERELNAQYKQTMIDQMQGKFRPLPGMGAGGRGEQPGGIPTGHQYGKLRNLGAWEQEQFMPALQSAMSIPIKDSADVRTARQALKSLYWQFQGTVYQPQIDDALERLDQMEPAMKEQESQLVGPMADEFTRQLLEGQREQGPQTRFEALPGLAGKALDFGWKEVFPYTNLPAFMWTKAGVPVLKKAAEWGNRPASEGMNPLAGILDNPYNRPAPGFGEK